MEDQPRNPNDRQNKTPGTKGHKKDDRKFTSYDTSRKETSTPQRVRQGSESSGEQNRQSKGDTSRDKKKSP